MNSVKKILDLMSDRKFSDALSFSSKAARAAPHDVKVLTAHAMVLIACKKNEMAFEILNNYAAHCVKQGKSLDPYLALYLAEACILVQKINDAKGLLIKLKPSVGEVEQYFRLTSAILRLEGNVDGALELLTANKEKLSEPKSFHEMAQCLYEKGSLDEAAKILFSQLQKKGFFSDSIDLWLKILSEQGRDREAQDSLAILAKKHPDVLEFVYGLAVVANKNGELPVANAAFEKCRELAPTNARILYEFGVLKRIIGELETSQSLIFQSLQLFPDNPNALRTYGQDLKYEYGDDNFKRLNLVAAKFSEFSDHDQVSLHFALANALDSVGEIEASFRHYSVGGAKKRKQDPFNEADALHLHNIIPRVVNKRNFSATNDKGSESDVPVFILGMPRSGTSLMEQILSAHPDVFGAGELKYLSGVLENIKINEARLRLGDKEPVFDYDDNVGWKPRGDAYVERLLGLADRKDYKRIVDKMPGNFNYLGLIHAILPKAKIIHSRRHPVETCLSIYRILFAEGHQWSYDLSELGRYYRRYWELMEYWRSEFPGVMYEAVYEKNVYNVESSARELIEYLELEWHPSCLEFYKLDRPVKTASVTQVRRPIYKSSTNRWRKYEKNLTPLLDEIGDIVEAYEKEIADFIKN